MPLDIFLKDVLFEKKINSKKLTFLSRKLFEFHGHKYGFGLLNILLGYIELANFLYLSFPCKT
jgi:hypothetical protein